MIEPAAVKGILEDVARRWGAVAAPQRPAGGAAPSPVFGREMLERGKFEQWAPLAAEVGARYGVPAGVVLALIGTESGGDHAAPGGLLGLHPGQFLEGEDANDPRTNLERGVSRLAAMAARHGGDFSKAALTHYGAADAAGNPVELPGGVSGFEYRRRFEDNLARYGKGG